jgi:hypothetical protein
MKKMKSGDTFAYRRGSGLERQEGGSHDHDTSVEKIMTIQKRGQQKEIQKPVCVLDYTKHLGGVDRTDNYCATCAFICKSLK